MEKTEQALAIIKLRGPVIPSQIATEIGTNILLAGAILSDLSSSGKVKVSSLKMGGSPFYYCEGQEDLLQNHLKYLNSKQVEAFNLLKESQVLRDRDLTPVIRVALREIKDFAKQLDVSIDGTKETFWKWYLLGKDETESMIKKKLGVGENKPELKKEAPVERQVPLPEALIAPKMILQPLPTQQETPVQAVPAPKAIQPKLKTKEPKVLIPEGPFFEAAMAFFNSSGIQVYEQSALKKSDFEFLIKFQSPVGEVKYYCAAKGKKRITADDISSAFARAQMKSLPALFLTQGDLSKDAEALLSKGLSITVKKV
jgi:hypothetical protein